MCSTQRRRQRRSGGGSTGEAVGTGGQPHPPWLHAPQPALVCSGSPVRLAGGPWEQLSDPASRLRGRVKGRAASCNTSWPTLALLPAAGVLEVALLGLGMHRLASKPLWQLRSSSSKPPGSSRAAPHHQPCRCTGCAGQRELTALWSARCPQPMSQAPAGSSSQAGQASSQAQCCTAASSGSSAEQRIATGRRRATAVGGEHRSGCGA